MIVEDDRDVREAIAEALSDHGHTVIEAGNGAEALRALRDGRPPPELILLDIMMPVMDGWQFRAEQVKDPVLAPIPVIVLSAHAAGADAASDMAVTAFLKKPVRLDALLDAIGKHATRR